MLHEPLRSVCVRNSSVLSYKRVLKTDRDGNHIDTEGTLVRQLLENVGGVCTAPIDTPARRTHCEPFLRQIDERRHPFEHVLLIDLLEFGVALDAS